jgi:hypothetical protein
VEALEAMSFHVKSRLVELKAEKTKGDKIVDYLPKEFILANEAVPLGMIRSAAQTIGEKSLKYICRWFNPFYRGQIAYLTLKDDPYWRKPC